MDRELRTFLYTGFDEEKKKNIQGRIIAKDTTEANEKLREKGIFAEYLEKENRTGVNIHYSNGDSKVSMPLNKSGENPNVLLGFISFLIPFVGLILGIVFVVKQFPSDKHTGTICLSWAIIGLVLALLLIGPFSILPRRIYSTKPEAGFVMPSISIAEPIVTFNEYKLIQTGMSYEEVTLIVGAGGEELSRNKIDGIPGVMESVETIMYQWVNDNGSNMNAMFQNDKLVQKAQFGLK